jgi:SAM-dependent methyltransferase
MLIPGDYPRIQRRIRNKAASFLLRLGQRVRGTSSGARPYIIGEKENLSCCVCGGTKFSPNNVLWNDLAAEWELSPEERAYIDRQQGTLCTGCGMSLRSIALAASIREAVGTSLWFKDFVTSSGAAAVSVLEINEAGTLGPLMRQMPKHVLAQYPAVDMHKMPYPDGSFDLVVHSDTLEHVAQPVLALAECRRVLRAGGHLCYTAPTIIGRLTRNRAGLPSSFHGRPKTGSDDYLVHTEFGADMWTYVIEAGFSSVTLHTLSFPDAIAISARK